MQMLLKNKAKFNNIIHLHFKYYKTTIKSHTKPYIFTGYDRTVYIHCFLEPFTHFQV
jgi:hypothetical protein